MCCEETRPRDRCLFGGRQARDVHRGEPADGVAQRREARQEVDRADISPPPAEPPPALRAAMLPRPMLTAATAILRSSFSPHAITVHPGRSCRRLPADERLEFLGHLAAAPPCGSAFPSTAITSAAPRTVSPTFTLICRLRATSESSAPSGCRT